MDAPIDLVSMALMVGASFVGRSFSGDKDQLVPLIMAAIRHPGPAFIDIISPCVPSTIMPGSTKAYDFVRAHNEAVNRLDIMEPREPITVEYAPGTTEEVALHDGSILQAGQAGRRLRSATTGSWRWPICRPSAARGELVTGLIYMDKHATDMHANLNTVDRPLNSLGAADLSPGAKALDGFNASHR